MIRTSAAPASSDASEVVAVAWRRLVLGPIAVAIAVVAIVGAKSVGLSDSLFNSIGAKETSKINVVSVSISALVGIQAELAHSRVTK